MRRPEETSEAGPDWLLVADLDDTLLGDDRALSAFTRAVAAAPALRWAVNSSRPLASVRAGLRRLRVELDPDAWIGAMGTEMETRDGPVDAWTGRFSGFDRAAVDRLLSTAGFPAHVAEYQTPRKASFAVPAGRRAEARQAIERAGVAAVTVASGASDFDVIPEGAGKGEATRFLAAHLGIDPERVVVAGDSGNDLAMFAVARHGIVVGNARAELRAALAGSGVYFADAARAEGVLEGLRHLGVLEAPR